jgi:hypothetical protein
VSAPAAAPNVDLSSGMVNSPLPANPAGNGAPGPAAPSGAMPQMPSASDPDLSGGMVQPPAASSLADQRAQQPVSGFLEMGRKVQLSNPATVPNARTRNVPRPDDPSKSPLENFVDGASTGALADAPLDVLAAHGAMTEGFKAFVPALTKGVQGVGEWAVTHPMAAKAVWETLKAVMIGTAAGTASKIIGKVINASPDQ